jgi:hypothetical protein
MKKKCLKASYGRVPTFMVFGKKKVSNLKFDPWKRCGYWRINYCRLQTRPLSSAILVNCYLLGWTFNLSFSVTYLPNKQRNFWPTRFVRLTSLFHPLENVRLSIFSEQVMQCLKSRRCASASKETGDDNKYFFLDWKPNSKYFWPFFTAFRARKPAQISLHNVYRISLLNWRYIDSLAVHIASPYFFFGLLFFGGLMIRWWVLHRHASTRISNVCTILINLTLIVLAVVLP